MNGSPNTGLNGTQAPPEEARLECRICWYVYDPAVGDPIAQVPPRTPFAALPAAWRCPQCDGPRDQFLRLDEPGGSGLD